MNLSFFSMGTWRFAVPRKVSSRPLLVPHSFSSWKPDSSRESLSLGDLDFQSQFRLLARPSLRLVVNYGGNINDRQSKSCSF